jgi:hypothetical protein
MTTMTQAILQSEVLMTVPRPLENQHDFPWNRTDCHDRAYHDMISLCLVTIQIRPLSVSFGQNRPIQSRQFENQQIPHEISSIGHASLPPTSHKQLQ